MTIRRNHGRRHHQRFTVYAYITLHRTFLATLSLRASPRNSSCRRQCRNDAPLPLPFEELGAVKFVRADELSNAYSLSALLVYLRILSTVFAPGASSTLVPPACVGHTCLPTVCALQYSTINHSTRASINSISRNESRATQSFFLFLPNAFRQGFFFLFVWAAPRCVHK